MSTTLQIVISVLAGGFITWFFSWFFFRRQNKRFRIAHFLTDAYDIGKGLTDVFPDFELTYKRETLSNIVYVLKGGFMNVGHGDIEGLEGKDDIKMILPEGCNVKDIVIIPSDERLIVNEQHEGNLIKFGIEKFFAPDEFFRYVAIVESKEEIESWGKTLKFTHRILKTKKEITNNNIQFDDNTILKIMFTVFFFGFSGVVLLYFGIVAIANLIDDPSLWYFWLMSATAFALLGLIAIKVFSFIDELHIKKVLRKSMKDGSKNKQK